MRTSPYTRERLEAAAQTSRTLTEALERLGVDPRSPTRKYVQARMRRLGVATDHFEREGVRWTREVLSAAVAGSKNVNEVLQRLGLDMVGGHHTHISRKIQAFGIDTSHFTTTSRRPSRNRSLDELLVEVEPGTRGRVKPDRLKRALLLLGSDERCAGCGIGPAWRGEPLALEVDHIDGNWRNNRPENLRLLCPNCHAATDTYRGRGKRRRAA
ncbi:HNH endonuclease signature motif containing protein [Streptomyces boninensis]|uniref:HNH endonuclease signature motif containing protein n=1 Tax=Streptomyces boninensis TaxID=2039455 RepID=UPI003B20C3E1